MNLSTTRRILPNMTRRLLIAPLLVLSLLLSGCGGGGGSDSPPPPQGADSTSQIDYSRVDVHLGFENEVSAGRINYPLYILASALDWLLFGEQFRQLGLLVDQWDQAQSGEIALPETSNVPLLGADQSVFHRQIAIVRTDWDTVGEMCGYGSSGEPNNGCAYNKNLPYCTIYVPHQEIYKNGDENAYHNLLGHEMWHCLVGSFH